jgi:hypothetical protein
VSAPYTYRATCGRPPGFIEHAAHGEPLCPLCRRAEDLLALEHERIPQRPSRPSSSGPLTADQVAANRRWLTELGDELTNRTDVASALSLAPPVDADDTAA